MHRVIRSPLGKAFVAIRDNDVRASLIGINVFLVRLTAFVMAGFLAGVAGALRWQDGTGEGIAAAGAAHGRGAAVAG